MGRTTDRVSARARAVPVSPIRRMFDLTPRVPGAISLAVGEPGFATPPHIVEAGCQALHDGFTYSRLLARILSLGISRAGRVNGD